MLNSDLFSFKNKYSIGFVVFLALLSIGIALDQLWVLLLPVLGFIIYVFLFRHDLYYFAIFSLVPVSVGLEKFTDFNIGLYFPTEPMIVMSALLLLFKFWHERSYPLHYLKHPISMVIILHLSWLLLTTLTSTMPVVSIKFFLVRFWYVFCFFFYIFLVFEKNPNGRLKTILLCYFIPLMGVIIYTIIRHTLHKYDEKAAHWVMQPFFKDHTSYGAILAMMTPFVLSFLFKKQKNLNIYILLFFVGSIFFTGLILSYTRAAWISLIGALFLYLILYFKVSIKQLSVVGFIILLVLVGNWENIIQKLEKNKQDASADLVEHVQSISNIASDASNLERINRWNCAWKMFQKKPVFGWGPGTYMFQYAPFQSSEQLTIISTNFADGGNAHSEYLGPLAESGLLGSLIFIVLVVAVIYYGVKTYHKADQNYRTSILIVLMGFVTYILHGILNNYLDTDKASVLFWSFAAFITFTDIQQSSQKATGQ